MKAFKIQIALECIALAQAQTAIISESPLMTAGIIAPAAAPGPPPPPPPPPTPPGAPMPAPMMPMATAAAQAKGGSPIIDEKPLMMAGIIAGSMKLDSANGIPQPDGAPAQPVSSAGLAMAGIVGGPADPQAVTSPTIAPAGIAQGGSGNTTGANPSGGVQGSQPLGGNSTIQGTSLAIVNLGCSSTAVWVGCVLAGAFIWL